MDAALIRVASATALVAAATLAAPAHAHESSTGNHAESYPLHRAASLGDFADVEHFLTAHEIHPSTPNSSRSTPLHYAVRHPSIVNRLIAAGANVNARNYSSGAQYSGETPLHDSASASGSSGSPCLPGVVATLLAAGADVNAEDSAGQTPLYEALRGEDGVDCPDVAVALIEAGGDTSPFHYNLNASGFPPNNNSPLYLLARNARGENELKPARALIRRGDDVNDAGGRTSWTPLYRAWYEAHGTNTPNRWNGLVDLLIENGAHYGVPCTGELVVDPRPSTSLNRLASDERKACICPAATHTEVNGDCQVNAVCAAPAVRNETTNLCDCPAPNLGADGQAAPGDCLVPNAERCGLEDPPLYYDAALESCGVRLYPCHESAVRLDDNSGCKCPPERPFSHGDPSDGSFAGIPDSAVCHAYSAHDPIMHDGDDGEWRGAVSANDPTLVAHFIRDHDADPNESGYYPLHEAAENDFAEAARALIEGGADVNRPDGSNDSPLHRAARYGAARAAAVLLGVDANPNLKNLYDDTALHILSEAADTAKNAGLVSLFLKGEADPNLRNGADLPPLDVAFQNGYRGLMAALIDGGGNWADPCTGGKLPNLHYRPSDGTPQCVCPRRLVVDNNGVCECPAATHLTVNDACLARADGAAVTLAVRAMRSDLTRLRGSLASLNLRLAAELETPALPRDVLESVAEQAIAAADEISRLRDNLAELSRPDAGPAPEVELSDTAAACRMLGGDVAWAAPGHNVCSNVDINDTFCFGGSRQAFSCIGLLRHVRSCNFVHNRPALDPFMCAAACASGQARGARCVAD